MKENNKFLFETGRLENLKLQGVELSISASTSVITSLDLLSLGLNELVEVLALFLETGQLLQGLPSCGEGKLIFCFISNYLLFNSLISRGEKSLQKLLVKCKKAQLIFPMEFRVTKTHIAF